MNKKQFLNGYTERRMTHPKKKYQIRAFHTKARTCRWTVTRVMQTIRGEYGFLNDADMLNRFVVGTATNPFCKTIQVLDLTEGVVYTISTEDFYYHGAEVRLIGREVQWGCVLKHWTAERVNPEQGKMEFGLSAQRVEH